MTDVSVKNFISELLALPPSPFIATDDYVFRAEEGCDVDMDYGGITSSNSTHPILGTTGLATCMGIAFYNRCNQEAGLVHLAQSVYNPEEISVRSRNALVSILEKLSANGTMPLEARINGPLFNLSEDIPFCSDICRILIAQPQLTVLSADLGGKPYCLNIGLDSRRWDEGFLKGSPPSIVSLDPVREIRAGDYKNLVDIKSLLPPPQNSYLDSIFDVRGAERPEGKPNLVPALNLQDVRL